MSNYNPNPNPNPFESTLGPNSPTDHGEGRLLENGIVGTRVMVPLNWILIENVNGPQPLFHARGYLTTGLRVWTPFGQSLRLNIRGEVIFGPPAIVTNQALRFENSNNRARNILHEFALLDRLRIVLQAQQPGDQQYFRPTLPNMVITGDI